MPIFTRAARSIFPITRTPKSTSCWTMPAPPATRNGASRITASWRKYWTGRCRGSGPSTITISRLPSPGSRASPSSTATSSICRVPGGTRSDHDMLELVGRKLIYLLPVLLAVTALTFLIAALLPGDLALAMLGDQATPENVAALHQKLGLDLPLWQQYLHWLRHVLSGDLGTSHRTGETVVHAIAGRLPVSLELLVIAQLGGLLIGVPLAMLCAVRPDSAVDRVVSGVAFGMLSMPPFLLAIVLIFIFALRLGILPATAYVPLAQDVLGNLRSMALPGATLALLEWPTILRVLRSDLISTLQEDYIAMARAKGLTARRILFVHALKPSSLTLVTVVGLNIGRLIGGAVITESIFALPGIGRLLVESIYTRDFIVLQGCVLFVAVAFVVVNFLVDLLYAALDPRIRHGRA